MNTSGEKRLFLFIDTSDKEQAVFALLDEVGEVVVDKFFEMDENNDLEVELLPVISALFEDASVDKSDLKGVIVVAGPGGFTSLRMGVTVANTLAWSLGIPVVGVEKSEFSIQKGVEKLAEVREFSPVLPEYGREPNIT